MQLAFNADVTDDPEAEELHAPPCRCSSAPAGVASRSCNSIEGHAHGPRPLAAALDMFELAADGFRRCGFVLGSLSTDANRGGLLLEQGHPAAAAELFDDVVRRAHAAGNTRHARWAEASGHRARAWAGHTDGAIEGLVECIRAHRDVGLASEADGLNSYLVEVLVLVGRFEDASQEAAALLPRLAASSSEVVVLTTRRLAAVAKHFMGDPGALDEVREVLDLARADDCAIEIARCLQVLELCSPTADEGWAQEREGRCRELGVTWMPPVTFARVD